MGKFFFATRKPSRCPNCSSITVARILWGLPVHYEKLSEDLAFGKIVLGGCCVTDCDPTWRCTACHQDIYSEKLRGVVEQAEKVQNDHDYQ